MKTRPTVKRSGRSEDLTSAARQTPRRRTGPPAGDWERELPGALRRAARIMDLDLDEQELGDACRFFALVDRVAAVRNLSAIHGADDVADLHWADSMLYLQAAPFADDTDCCLVDVGSGPGIPGLPLLLRRRTWSGVLVERSATKAAFLRLAVGELGLRDRCSVLAEDALKLDWRALAETQAKPLWVVTRAALNPKVLAQAAANMDAHVKALTVSAGAAMPPSIELRPGLLLGALRLSSWFSGALPLSGTPRTLATFTLDTPPSTAPGRRG